MKRILLPACLLAALAIVPSALAGADDHHGRAPQSETLAIIGDIPYGPALIAEFPQDVGEIDADPAVRRVVHLGDIKDGASRCDDSYFQARLADFQTFADPLVYTPGDNEWTDCHRATNGGYVPTERLAAVRRTFFPRPSRTLGARTEIDFQSRRYPENTRWSQAGVTFGVVHVVGSNDDQAPWFGDRTDAAGHPAPETPAERALRMREYTGREAAALEWVDAIFDSAERRHATGVVLGMQADMYDPSAAPAGLSAFAPIKAVIADRAQRFGKPVLLLEGDSHEFHVDRPADQPANLTRVVVEGSTTTPHEWLRLHVDPASPQVFSCENVEFVTRRATPCPAPLAP
jgi:hypothetical protein